MKKLHRKIFSVIIFVSILGCGHFSTAPPDNVDFGKIEKIEDLDGIYRNLGVGGEDTGNTFLSKIIWAKDTEMEHSEIKSVEVRAVTDTKIKVSAHGKNGILKESEFVAGEDFKIESGHIVIEQKASIAGFKSGEAAVGPYFESIKLGLDKRGHGKLRKNFAFVGAAFLIVPMAVSASYDARFERISE